MTEETTFEPGDVLRKAAALFEDETNWITGHWGTIPDEQVLELSEAERYWVTSVDNDWRDSGDAAFAEADLWAALDKGIRPARQCALGGLIVTAYDLGANDDERHSIFARARHRLAEFLREVVRAQGRMGYRTDDDTQVYEFNDSLGSSGVYGYEPGSAGLAHAMRDAADWAVPDAE